MNKLRFFVLTAVLVLMLGLGTAAFAMDNQPANGLLPETPPEGLSPDGQVASTGALPGVDQGIQSLSGSFVTLDPSAGGSSCYVSGAAQTFCFRAESFTTDYEYVYNLWQKFPTDWTVTNVYVQGTPTCDAGSWGTFGWAFQTASYEVNISHPRYQQTIDHCTAYYCFEVTSGTGAPNALESWYWDGDGYGGTPHNPCSYDGYTPAGQNACDEAFNPPATIPPCALYLDPPTQNASGCNGIPQVHNLNLTNNTGFDGYFDLFYNVSGLASFNGPNMVYAMDGATVPITVTLEPYSCAVAPIIATIDAAGNGYSDSSTITKTIYTDPFYWPSVEDSAPAWGGGGYPRDGCTAQNAAGDWVTYLISDTTGIPGGLWGYHHATNTWFDPGAANTPAGRWAPDWAYDAETNLCYLTGGATSPGGGNLTSAYVFDPAANAFTQLGDITSARDFHTSWVGVLNGVKYLCIGGGVNSGNTLIQSTQCYSLSQTPPGVWNAENAQMAALPTDPFGAADGVLHAASGDQFWYVGGAINSGTTVTDQAWYWDDADDAWHSAGNTGAPRYRVEGDFFNGAFYQFGGASAGFTPTNTAVRGDYDGANWVWTAMNDLANPRMDNVVAVTPDNIWSVTGYGSNSPDHVDYLGLCPECVPQEIEVSPQSLHSIQPAGWVLYRELEICNAGVDPLHWSIYEMPVTNLQQAAGPSLNNAPLVATVDALQSENVVPFEGMIEGVPGIAPAAPLGGMAIASPDAVLWDNGPLVTHPADCTGLDASRLQNVTLGMSLYGFGNQVLNNNHMADDFVISGAPWQIDQITLFAYQTGASGSSTITGVYLQIWDGPPNDPGSSVVWGDMTTNVMVSTTLTNVLRDYETTTCGNTRIIAANTVTVGATLPPGTYWLDWMTDGSLASGPWAPPITILGQTTTGNSMQYLGSTSLWQPALDTGTSTQQDMPFIIEGDILDIPWLSEDPLNGTIPASTCQLVEVAFDAHGMSTGDEVYGSLQIISDDPDEPEIIVPVTMTLAEAHWDKEVWINGVVYDPFDSPFTVMVGDEVTVIDRVWFDDMYEPINFRLTDNWDNALELTGYTADFGTITTTVGSLNWRGIGASPMITYTLEKSFDVVDVDSFHFTMEEIFFAENMGMGQYILLNFNIPIIANKEAPPSAVYDEIIPYTITLDFPGVSYGTAVLTDVLPAGVEFAGNLTATFGTAWYDTGAVYWNGFPVACAPSEVLWEQTLSLTNTGAYVDQNFTDFPTYSSYQADDFVASEPWLIDSLFVPGDGWNGFTTLLTADALTWEIYADNGGIPNGNPGGSPPLWSLTLPPTDTQVTITPGTPGGLPSNTLLKLDTPISLPPGHYWLIFYPTASFTTWGQYGRQPADTTNGYTAQFINPGGGFGYGTAWQNWNILGPAQQDTAFRIEGIAGPVGPASITITFDAQVTLETGGEIINQVNGVYNGSAFYAEASTLVSPITADLAVNKLDSPDPVGVGELLTYNLIVENLGPDGATDVVLVDTLPPGTTFVSASPGCVHASGVVTCNIGTMAPAANLEITIVVHAPDAVGTITNTASVSGSRFDPTMANNTSDQQTEVVQFYFDIYLPTILKRP